MKISKIFIVFRTKNSTVSQQQSLRKSLFIFGAEKKVR